MRYTVFLIALVMVTALGLFLLDTRNDGSVGHRMFRSVWDAFNGVTTLGDFSDLNQSQKIYMMLSFAFVVTLGSYALTALGELLVGQDMSELRETRRTRRAMQNVANHIILIGYNALGVHLARRLAAQGSTVVVIDRDEEAVSRAALHGHVAVRGDAGADATLLDAGIKNAAALVVTLSQGADRVAITLMSRAMNPKLHIVGLAITETGRDWLQHAGANDVISREDLVADAFCKSLDAARAPAR